MSWYLAEQDDFQVLTSSCRWGKSGSNDLKMILFSGDLKANLSKELSCLALAILEISCMFHYFSNFFVRS